MFGRIRCNLKDAVQLAGLAWEGRPHCGLDDACNTARLLTTLMRRGIRFSITNSLLRQPTLENRPMDLGAPSSPPQRRMKEPMMGAPFQCYPFMDPMGRELCPYCYCGVRSYRGMVRRPGLMQGRGFYGCGNWTAARRAVCNYFAWASWRELESVSVPEQGASPILLQENGGEAISCCSLASYIHILKWEFLFCS